MTRPLTEEQPGGTTPDTEATASVDPQADRPAGAIALADEPTEPAVGETDGAAPITVAASDEDAAATGSSAEAEVPAAAHDAPGSSVQAQSPAEGTTSDGDVAEGVSEPAAADAPSEEPTVAASTTVDAEETADAPAADDEAEPEPVAPPRELGPEPTTMEELLAEQDSDIKSFKHGDVVEGNVVRIDKDEILVDIGAKS